MTRSPEHDGHQDDRPLDEATAALRDAGAADAASVPPELRRATLHALWAADAQRYEIASRRRAKALQWVFGAAAVVIIVGAGAFLLVLAAVSRRPDGHWSRRLAPVPPPPPATRPIEPPVVVVEPGNPPTMMPAGVVVLGSVVLAGTPPSPRYVDLSAVPECRMCHPDGLLVESVVGDGNGGLANVVLSIARADGQPIQGPKRTIPAVLDQRGCRYMPHVLAVMVGQPIVVRNSDPFLHNVHALSLANAPFNFGQPNVDPGRKIDPMKLPERFVVKCDVHPWMKAHVNVFDHPYFAVSAADGTFQVPGSLPDGAYTLTAWHEVFGEQTARIQIAGGQPVVANITFTATGAGMP